LLIKRLSELEVKGKSHFWLTEIHSPEMYPKYLESISYSRVGIYADGDVPEVWDIPVKGEKMKCTLSAGYYLAL
jgi:hypothetical protein